LVGSGDGVVGGGRGAMIGVWWGGAFLCVAGVAACDRGEVLREGIRGEGVWGVGESAKC